MANVTLKLSVLPEPLAICRVDAQAEIPDWATPSPYFSITRTSDELSIVCSERLVPAGITCDRGWRVLKLEGPLDLALVGILATVAVPLAKAGVSIFTIATYDTDYVLVKQSQLDLAIATLSEEGHSIHL
jgi:hypothetical protein